MTLRARIYLLVAMAIMPAFALIAYDHYRSFQDQVEHAEQQALRSTLLISAELDQIITGLNNLLRAAAQTPGIRDFRNPDCTQYLERLEQLNATAAWIVAADDSGAVRCGRRSSASFGIGDRDYFAAAQKSNELVIGTYTIDQASGAAILPVAIRIQTSEGVGVLVAGVRLTRIRELFAARFAELPANSSLTIVDRNGTILVRLPNSNREGKPLSNYNYVVNASKPGTFRSSAEKNADGVARFLGFTPLNSPPSGLAVAVGFPQEQTFAQVRDNAIRNYVLFGLVAIVAIAASVLGSRAFIHRPMTALLSTIQRWRRQELTARVVNVAGRSEFDEIGRAFNSMADELEAAVKHKDVLLRELNHRIMNSLQTVSALFRLQAGSVNDPSAAALFEQAIRRIDAIALAYRRMQTTGGVESVDFASFLAALCQDFNASIMTTPCVVKADPIALPPNQAVPLTLIANELITNAVKHAKRNDDAIVINLQGSNDHCRLAVLNKGSLPEGFNSASGGFGMKMISAMVQQLRGNLEITSTGNNTEFAVTFKPQWHESPDPGV